MALYRSLRSSTYLTIWSSKYCLAKILPNSYPISCDSPVINHHAIAIGTILWIKISFYYFKAAISLILHEEIVWCLIDGIKTTSPYEICSSGVRIILLPLSIYNWIYITVSRVSARINFYLICFGFISFHYFFLQMSKWSRHRYHYNHFMKVWVAKSILNANKWEACWKKLRYSVFVKFSPAGKIIVYGDQITISLRSKPERGKANRELIQKLADYFEIDKERILIISGRTSNKKLVEVDT